MSTRKRKGTKTRKQVDSDDDWTPEKDKAVNEILREDEDEENSSDDFEIDPVVEQARTHITKRRKLSFNRQPSSSACESSQSQEVVDEEIQLKSNSDGPPTTKSKRKPKKKKETAEERVHRLHPEVKGVWQTLSSPSIGEDFHTIEAQKSLLVELLPFQKEGLAWMNYQEEKSEFGGGILADEMGMGKTIQTIALLCLRPPSPKYHKPCLIVCPSVALLQWHGEIQARTQVDTFKTLVYHGSTRKRDVDLLKEYDIILTTYATVESEWRRQQSGFQRKGQKVKEPSTLHSLDWHRIILDEAHFIKDRSSSTARAMFGLNGDFKWSLSGTPLQNRVGELFSLVKFLKADPYSYYFCRQCDCKSLHWKFSDYKRCDDCGHAGMSHFCWWNREILRPIQKYGPVGAGQLAFDRLHQLLGSMMLRRTKAERGGEMGLPPRVIHTRRDLFSHEEEDFYEALYSESKTKFESFVQQGTVLNNYAHIFELLMRMRQAVNHPWLVTHKAQVGDVKYVCGICHEEAEDAIQSQCHHTFCREDAQLYLSSCVTDTAACPVCFRPLSIDLTQPTIQKDEDFEVSKRKKKKTNIVSRLDLERWQSSTKIEALLEELTEARDMDIGIKSIVFSQFTQFLDLLEWRFQREGIRCVRLDGRMSPKDRANVIEAFNTVPEISVFLISLKAGGLALNLVAASRVYLCDPWWNPAVEAQAMDRIHRLGQHRPVEVRRLIIENSIESRIDELQEKKRLLFESTVGQNTGALNRLTENDLKFLFVL